MKLINGLLLSAFLLLTMASCSKDDDTSAIVGTWEGHWGFDFDKPSFFEGWELKKGGELVAYNSNGGELGRGRWKVNGFNFECEYTVESSNSTYLFKGLYSDVAGEIVGNWGEKPSSADGGTFEMYKQ